MPWTRPPVIREKGTAAKAEATIVGDDDGLRWGCGVRVCGVCHYLETKERTCFGFQAPAGETGNGLLTAAD